VVTCCVALAGGAVTVANGSASAVTDSPASGAGDGQASADGVSAPRASSSSPSPSGRRADDEEAPAADRSGRLPELRGTAAATAAGADVGESWAPATARPFSALGEAIGGSGLDLAVTLDPRWTRASANDGSDPSSRSTRTARAARDRAAADARARADVEALAADRGARIGVEVLDLSDGQVLLALDADRSFTSASTYKLVVVSSIVDTVASADQADPAAAWTWDSPLSGRTVEQCVEDTIILSDNDCPVDWLDVYGYPQMEAHAQAIGAAHTTFTPSDFRTTPADMATIARRLSDGDLMDAADTQWVEGLMRQQVYREGVPVLEAEVPGVTVADKVGWLDGVNNDVAIVSTPHGDYVFSIFTEDADWGLVADLARTIEAWLAARPPVTPVSGPAAAER